MIYRSTRNYEETATASEAILKGLANEGGLFVPDEIPELDVSFEELAEMDYKDVAYEVMSRMFDDFTEKELRECIEGAYDSKFDTDLIAPVKYHHGAYILELFHGKTIAFKDMALSILPYLMTTAARKNNMEKEIVILTATSGDTGKAALAGFADVPGTKIAVFYPKNGVSPIQEKQMVTEKGKNTFVAGITGNFDDAQTGVKKMFSDKALAEYMDEKGYVFSSANSINIGRLVPQIVYYTYAYCKLLAEGHIKDGEKIHVTVPTGNFGNILAAYYAKKIGVPIDKLICASNTNKVLFDFFETGRYDRNREFVLTSSPSMDILISSNLERLIYHIAGDNCEVTAKLMKNLTDGGIYDISDAMRDGLKDFASGYATEEDTAEAIRTLYERTGYVIDPHTAVASHVYREFVNGSRDNTRTVIASTASPFKFARSVMAAIEGKVSEEDDFTLIDRLSAIANVALPPAITELRTAPVRHDTVCRTEDMKLTVSRILGL